MKVMVQSTCFELWGQRPRLLPMLSTCVYVFLLAPVSGMLITSSTYQSRMYVCRAAHRIAERRSASGHTATYIAWLADGEGMKLI